MITERVEDVRLIWDIFDVEEDTFEGVRDGVG